MGFFLMKDGSVDIVDILVTMRVKNFWYIVYENTYSTKFLLFHPFDRKTEFMDEFTLVKTSTA